MQDKADSNVKAQMPKEIQMPKDQSRGHLDFALSCGRSLLLAFSSRSYAPAWERDGTVLVLDPKGLYLQKSILPLVIAHELDFGEDVFKPDKKGGAVIFQEVGLYLQWWRGLLHIFEDAGHFR